MLPKQLQDRRGPTRSEYKRVRLRVTKPIGVGSDKNDEQKGPVPPYRAL